MRLASKQELYQRIIRIDRWIRNNSQDHAGIVARLQERADIVRFYDEAPEHDGILVLCGSRGPVRPIPEITVTIDPYPAYTAKMYPSGEEVEPDHPDTCRCEECRFWS